MADSIMLNSPLDMHVHFRQGLLPGELVPHTAATFAGALVMPNIEPPVDHWLSLRAYRATISEAAGKHQPFKPYMTAYFRTTYTEASLKSLLDAGVTAIKFYPRGLTTNSNQGCQPNDPGVLDVLGMMEELDIPLSVHAEAPGYHEDREELFGPTICRWATRYPGLRIILEHLSDIRSRRLLDYPNVHATITPHHMLLTGDELMGPPFRTHHYCMPVLKRPEDRSGLRWLATSSYYSDKIMLGTDSAPHAREYKESANCCAGIFSAPIALQLVADIFEQQNALDKLQSFVSDNARRIYRLQPPEKQLKLCKQPFTIPQSYGEFVPLLAGQVIPWSIEQ